MPKLPLDRATLKLLPGVAIEAARHPRRTATQVVSGSLTVVGRLLDRRPATEPVPGMAAPPPVETEPAELPDEATAEAAAELPDELPAELPEEVPEEVPEEAAGPVAFDDELDEDATDVRPEGPAPHMPPRIAGAVERDYEEDIPGIRRAGGS